MYYRYIGQVPSRCEKEELKLAEEQVSIGLRATAAQLHQTLLLVYPKLELAGGYEIMRCFSNSPPTGCHSPERLKRTVGQARIYVGRLQRDLDLRPQGVGDSQQTF